MTTAVLIAVALLMLATGLALGWYVGQSAANGATRGAEAERDGARTQRDELREERDELRGRLQVATTDVARLGASLEHERASAIEAGDRDQRHEQQLREAFASLSAEALSKSSREFITLAETRLKQAGTEAGGDLAQRQLAIEGLLEPMRGALAKVEEQMRSMEVQREGAYRALSEQVGTMRETSAELRTETKQLVTALRAPQQRGRWGEVQLEQMVRNAGMVEHCDFETQASVRTEDGAQRPDMIVKLAGGKRVVVDAKVSFIGFLEAMEATDERQRNQRMAAHARHLREHVDRLAAKSYWQAFDPTPEFVVMFVPAEVFLNAALEKEPALLEYAFERNVVIATPPTFIALLRTIAYAWRQSALADNAAAIHRLGRELHTRLATMGGHMTKLGVQLGRAVDSYNLTVSSLESRVLVSARKLADLKVTDDRLETPEQLTQVPRQVQQPELVASAEETLRAINE
ncbi:MAG: DNA recombination protein RmuC [Mycobacteriales bacterium]